MYYYAKKGRGVTAVKTAQKPNIVPRPAAEQLVELLLSPYDELVEIDLSAGTVRNLRHAEGKYYVPMDEFGTEQAGDSTDLMIHPDDREAFLRFTDPTTTMKRLAASPTPGMIRAKFRYRLLAGGYRLVEQVNVGGPAFSMPEGLYYSFLYDAEAPRQERGAADSDAEREEAHERHLLTGLLWEEGFFKRAKERLHDGLARWCVIAADIENFKLFNEWYGRSQGDLMLAQLGAALRDIAERVDGLAGYCGQDDFVLLAPFDEDRIRDWYEELHALVRRHGASVGFMPAFGVTPVDGVASIEELYDRASLASHQAKETYHTRICTFDPAMYEQTEKDYQILSDFQKGLENGEMTFYLQPQCAISSGRVMGAESLVRWRKPDGTFVSPAVFVPVLEEYGFVTELDQFVWEAVCAWQRKWIDGGHTALPISVNVSQIDIFTIDVPDYFAHLLERYRLPPETIKVEITESAYAENDKVSEAVRRLRGMGLLVLMDDFGSGYSSLNMLRNLNVDIIKLDAQFLRMNGEDRRKGLQIMESIVGLARTMGVPTIVEGVESQEERDFLAGLGCRYVQGFYFYRPMPAEEFERLIGEPENIDTRGFRFKAKEQFHTRDFLDGDVFTDTVLNNILGPVAFYAWQGENVNVIRYNSQFYEETRGQAEHDKELCKQVVEEDVPKLYELLEGAIRNPLNGSEGVLRVRQADGSVRQYRMHFFFMEEDEGGKKFYGSVQDLTRFITLGDQMRLLSKVSADSVVFLRRRRGRWSFQVVIHALEAALRMSREEIERELNDGTFYKRVDDGKLREMLLRVGDNTSPDVGLPKEDVSFPLRVTGGEGKPVALRAQFCCIHDKTSGVEYILLLRSEADGDHNE